MSTRKMPEEEFGDSYLWDGSGEPNPEVQRLEKSLAAFRHRGEAPSFPASLLSAETKILLPFLQRLWPRRLAAFAAMAAVTVAISFLVPYKTALVAPRPGWDVVRLE